ncbi:MAG TPA: squalene--hopene cyclase, partial [Pirellulales bacterium]|nr:squalene--hopene cyclase [Pirellulales bacterium]
LSEAYAMSGDRRLLPAVQRALQYTINTQDRASGGRRYQVGQVGDTSQLGWQVMALKSAELGGIAMPSVTRAGIERFLASVASGTSRGLACYQPTRPIPTRSMTAEALVCRQFLGRTDRPETIVEATSFVLQEPPGSGTPNHYYWYYGTLAMYQSGGEPWQRWNEALQKQLLSTQRLDGSYAGSWDPDKVWGSCGGRVYSTSLCALCLEVYYRFLPLYVRAADRDQPRR